MKLRFPLHIHISTLFLVLILVVGGLVGTVGYRISQDILENSANELSTRIGRETVSDFTSIVAPAEMAARLASQGAIGETKTHDERWHFLGLMREVLHSARELTSIYIGFSSGDFFLMRRLHDEADRMALEAPPESVYVVQSIERSQGAARGRFVYLDAQLSVLRSDERPDYAAAYDPRERHWYKAAMHGSGQVKTAPYIFFISKQVGTTFANRALRGEAVIGVDIRLESLNHILSQQKVTPGSKVVLAHPSGQVIAYEDGARIVVSSSAGGEPELARLDALGVPVFAKLLSEKKLDAIAQRTNLELTVDGQSWRVRLEPFVMEGTQTLFIITAIPDAELMASAHKLLRQAFFVIVLIMLLVIPVTLLLARSVSKPLRKLSHEAEAIRRFEFSAPISVESYVLEVNELAQTMDGMKDAIRRFLDISMAVAAEQNFDRLLPHLLQETLSAADASAGVLYLNDDETLRPAAALRADGSTLPVISVALHAGPGESALLRSAIDSRQACSRRLDAAEIAALGLADAISGYAASHAVAVPLLNRQQTLVGAMILLRQDDTDANRLSFISALSGSAAVSLETKELIHAQKRLFEALIQLIAGAIDAKSAYTGGHCARVPALAKRLAEAACADEAGPYRDFSLSEEEWEALHIASWLHDCGKLTTPEYVVDKATKLETLYDRIHEIRTRFEVLKRDAQIASLEAIIAGTPEAQARSALAAELAQLDADFAFVAQCNEGGEFMAPEKKVRLAAIAERTWLRTLDDRIGISQEEKGRKDKADKENGGQASEAAARLPVLEKLLADKPEHRFERSPQERLAEDNPLKIRMEIPELRYNQGELYNLGIARGTLTDEERYKINEHIVQTLLMLSRLPFPKHLRQVPEIAGGHHEKMDGTGYPRRLRRDEMSLLARMMAIADIFEALTAVDRPYKKGKTLSEAISIMARMKDGQHLDPDLFDLFLRSGAYLDYARQYMRPEQIDTVDIAAFVSPLATSE